MKNTKTKTKTAATRGVKIKSAQHKSSVSSWSLSIYVYWFIILFFIAATLYILGRSHFTAVNQQTEKAEVVSVQTEQPTQKVEEEILLKASDYYITGRDEILAGDLDGAIADLTTAIAADSQMVDAYILRGEAYMQNGDYRNAMQDFDTAIAIDTASSVAYYDRALLNTRLEDFNSAMNDINNAIAAYAMKPNDVLQMRDMYAKRGQLNLWQKNWEGAIADYTNSLSHPSGTVSSNVYAERAEAYTALGQYANAINDYTSAIRVISEQIQGATTMEQKEDLSMRAMNYFEKSAALNLQSGNGIAANSDLTAAYAIATSLGDTDSIERLKRLLSELQ